MKHFEVVCQDQGVKLTHQRIEIFREVAQTADHPDAEEIFKRIRTRLPTVSLDTVYRTLWLLNDLGLVRTLKSGSGRTRFDANLDSHHHFVCSRCGLTRDFYSSEFDELKLPDTLETLGEVTTTHIEARGVCHDCLINST